MSVEIKCYLRSIPEFPCLFSNKKTKTRLGRYHSSYFPGVPSKHYPVAVYIDGNIKESKADGWTEDLIIDEFLNSVNVPFLFLSEDIKGKKKKKKVGIFGNLTKYSYEFKLDSEGREYIIAILLTDDKKNKNFWGEGIGD